MLVRTTLALAVALSGTAAALAAPPKDNAAARSASGCARLPAGWKLDEMVAAFGPAKGATARVLAWQIDEDSRPLRVESVLLWLERPGGKGYGLVNLYRHPQDKQPSWHLSMVYDAPHVGFVLVRERPDRAVLDKFLVDTWWTFGPRDGFRLMGSEVCAAAWQQAFGKPPWRAYAK